jgi:heterodisulfide reductase subunit C
MQICPNTVKPSELIDHIRRILLKKNIIPIETVRAYRILFERFQRVRRHVVVKSLQGELNSISDRQWCDWLLTPVKGSLSTIRVKKAEDSLKGQFPISDPDSAAACFTCGECSSACPVACERSVFDPRSLFRMVNLGLTDELLTSPAIWLCLDCGRCTAACSQLVDGRAIVRRLRDNAIQKGIIDRNFLERLKQANRLVYSRWLKEVDALFGFKGEAIRSRTTPIFGFSVCCEEYRESTFAYAGG